MVQSNQSPANVWAKAFAKTPSSVMGLRAGGAHAHPDGDDGQTGPHDHADISTMIDGHGKRLDDHEDRIGRLEDGHAGDGSHGGS